MGSTARHARRTLVVVYDSSRLECELLVRSLKQGQERFAIEVWDGDLSTLPSDGEVEDRVAVVSLRKNNEHALNVLRLLSTRHPNLPVVAILDTREPADVVDVFRAGVKGVFYRTEPFELLLRCISSVSQGQVWACSADLKSILNVFSHDLGLPMQGREPSERNGLTKRELQVANLVAHGLTNREIADQLHLQEHTVKNYVFNIFDKLRVSNRVELVLYIHQENALRERSDESASSNHSASPSPEPEPGRRQSKRQPV